MLRGPEVSSQAWRNGGEARGGGLLWGGGATAWICMEARYPSAPLLCFPGSYTHTHTKKGSRAPLEPALPYYTSTAAAVVAAAAWQQPLLEPRGSVSEHRGLCLCLPGAVTSSLLAPAQGKYTQSCRYEVRPAQEPVTRCLTGSYLVGFLFGWVSWRKVLPVKINK